jgi:predicted nucleotidyltransferase
VTRNVEMLVAAARAFGDLRDEVVFVGGAIVDLLVTDPAAPRPRFTDDVDVVVEVTTQVEWYALGERLRTLGFREDRREGAPLCRWLTGELAVDVMPGIEKVLGFANRWYPLARQQSDEVALPDGPTIRVVQAPLFLAMKAEAFASRGKGDFVASHDIEDVIAVVDGRLSLALEVETSPTAVLRFLAERFGAWLEDPRFLDAVPGHLPGDAASQARAELVVERMKAMVRE